MRGTARLVLRDESVAVITRAFVIGANVLTCTETVVLVDNRVVMWSRGVAGVVSGKVEVSDDSKVRRCH